MFSRAGEFTPAIDASGVRCGVDEEPPAGEDEVATGDVEIFYSVWAWGRTIGSLSGCFEPELFPVPLPLPLPLSDICNNNTTLVIKS